jgi:protein-S-isoprenylcysteine O-methyltransferase Ste14
MTTHRILRELLDLPWILLAAYWFLSGLKTRPAKHKEPFVSRYGVMLLVVAGWILLFNGSANFGVLDRRFVPHDLTLSVLGVALTWLGIGLAIWARVHLGQNWSSRVAIKEDHELIRTGPYAHLRHPIYSGLVLAAAGTAIEMGEWRCVLAFIFLLTGFSMKALKEESMLGQQFGNNFEEHRRHTGFLLPRFR